MRFTYLENETLSLRCSCCDGRFVLSFVSNVPLDTIVDLVEQVLEHIEVDESRSLPSSWRFGSILGSGLASCIWRLLLGINLDDLAEHVFQVPRLKLRF